MSIQTLKKTGKFFGAYGHYPLKLGDWIFSFDPTFYLICNCVSEMLSTVKLLLLCNINF